MDGWCPDCEVWGPANVPCWICGGPTGRRLIGDWSPHHYSAATRVIYWKQSTVPAEDFDLLEQT